MKKLKLLLIIVLLVAIVGITMSTYAATTLTMDDWDNASGKYHITLPTIITNGEATIKLNNTTGILYYQFVEMSDSQKTLLENAQQDLKDAQNNYTEKKTEESYNEYIVAFEKYINTIPKFSDNSWIQTTGDIKLDTTKFSGKKGFALWAKLVDGDKTVYDAATTTLSGTKVEENTEESESEEKTEPSTDVTWTDFSKAKIKFELVDNGTNFKRYNLKFDNITYKETSTYYIYTTRNKNKPTITYDSDGRPENADGTIFIDESRYSDKNKNLTLILEEYGDIYVWVVEYDMSAKKSKTVLSSQKLTRPDLNNIGSRLMAYFFNERTNIFCYENKDEETERKLNIKIGKVKNTDILKAIKNEDKDALKKLMDYAKTSKAEYSKTFKVKDRTNQLEAIAPKINLVDDEYYYVYMCLDGEENKYTEIEDVSLYQALVSESVGKNLFDYLSDEFKWNLSEDENTATDIKKDNTTADKKIPYAGMNVIFIATISIFIVASIVLYYENRKYRDIK